MHSKDDADAGGGVFLSPPMPGAEALTMAQMLASAKAPCLAADEVDQELKRVLASSHFVKARRMSDLLCFLVRHSLVPDRKALSEYAIGMAVFGRNPSQYNPGDDPIVRVQVGRLRTKLRAYYEGEGKANRLRMDIPLGTYEPRFERRAGHQATKPRLVLQPLVCIGDDQQVESFTLGLTEELVHRLYCAYGQQCAILMHSDQGDAPHPPVTMKLQGSVRQDGHKVRTAVRVHDVIKACIAWSDRFDHDNDFSIARQEQLAEACCLALQALLSST